MDKRTPQARPAPMRRGGRKVSVFDLEPTLTADYKNPAFLRRFLTEEGEIIPRRISGNSAQWQRRVTRAIKRARMLGLLPFSLRNT
jgi:small subunit ribosomal protein S18